MTEQSAQDMVPPEITEAMEQSKTNLEHALKDKKDSGVVSSDGKEGTFVK